MSEPVPTPDGSVPPPRPPVADDGEPGGSGARPRKPEPAPVPPPRTEEGDGPSLRKPGPAPGGPPREPAVAAYAALVPVALAAALVVGPPAYGLYLLWPFAPLVLLAVWWLPAPLLLLAGVQRLLAGPLYGCRPPTDEEAERLREPWRKVLAAAGLGEGRYLLRVTDSTELNARPAGGSVVTVTSHAAGELAPAELAAVLAHELGHRLGPPPVPGRIRAVLMAPVRAVWRAGRAGPALVRAAHQGAKRWRTPAGFLGVALLAALVAVVSAVAAVPTAVAYLGLLLSGTVGPRAEYAADRAAAALGLGPDLLALLEKRVDAGEYGDTRRGRATVPDRAQRLRRALAGAR